MTQIEAAQAGNITREMELVAEQENLDVKTIQEGLAQGTIVIPANPNHKNLIPCGIGKGLRTKVNANIGTSSDFGSLDTELAKLKIAIKYHADTVMDLSTGKDIKDIRHYVLQNSPLPVGTVPIYEAGIAAISRHGSIVGMTEDELFDVIETQAREGVDFITVHCGVTRNSIERLKKQGRVADIVSRGGAFLTGWILHNNKENPLFEQFDRLLAIARKYDVTLSLGDGMRPGSLSDSTDRAQLEELIILGELADKARAAGVQVMIEGPGHVPLNQIEANIRLQKAICKEAPFYVLGPLVTDIGAGYDHITGAIGGAIAAAAGADFLCYVTPAEHLSLPDVEDVKNGIIASRIAAHAADIVKGIKNAANWDRNMSQARKRLDWEEQAKLSIDPERFMQLRNRMPSAGKTCSMCGQFCAMKLVEQYLGVSGLKC